MLILKDTGLIPSSVNWAFTSNRKNQRETIRHLITDSSCSSEMIGLLMRCSYFIPCSISDTFLVISWVIFWVILWVILSVRLQKPTDYLPLNLIPLLLWIQKKISQMFGKHSWSFEDTYLSNTWILVQSDKNHYTALVFRQYRCSENSNSAASVVISSSDLNMRDLI